MKNIHIIKNSDITSALLAAPEGHRHLRLALTTNDGDTVVLQEATVAAIVRAYTTVKTHPAKKVVKMVSAKPAGLKEGYAEDQLIEMDVDDADVVAELTALLKNAR